MIVTVDEVKTHLRIQHDEEDDYIESLIKQAQTAAEDYCRVQFEPEPEPRIPNRGSASFILECLNHVLFPVASLRLDNFELPYA